MRPLAEQGTALLQLLDFLFCTHGVRNEAILLSRHQLPHIVLNESGLAFERIKVDEHAKATDGGAYYRSVNPLGYVPALQRDDGTILTEAAAIVQYLADKVPAKRLVPANGTIGRAKLQSWLNFLSAEMHLGCFCPLFHPQIPEPVKMIFRERLASRRGIPALWNFNHLGEKLDTQPFHSFQGLTFGSV